MKKSVIRWAVILAAVLVTYHVVIFALPVSKTPVFWVSYAFTLLAMAVQVYVIRAAFYQGEGIKSKFYGFPIAKIGVSYLALQLLLSLVFMAVGTFTPVWIPSIIYAISLCVVVIGLVAADATRDEVERQDAKLKKQISNMRTLQVRVEAMISLVQDSGTVQALQKFAEALRFSDPVSIPALQEIESKLTISIDELQRAVQSNDPEIILSEIQKAKGILAERNRVCKITK